MIAYALKKGKEYSIGHWVYGDFEDLIFNDHGLYETEEDARLCKQKGEKVIRIEIKEK